jgi:hypothetical protein
MLQLHSEERSRNSKLFYSFHINCVLLFTEKYEINLSLISTIFAVIDSLGRKIISVILYSSINNKFKSHEFVLRRKSSKMARGRGDL